MLHTACDQFDSFQRTACCNVTVYSNENALEVYKSGDGKVLTSGDCCKANWFIWICFYTLCRKTFKGIVYKEIKIKKRHQWFVNTFNTRFSLNSV